MSESLKVGLALSGGGAKGFAHIGVLKVLEEAGIQVDIITGTSMGSIVGGLYAIGYTPQQLEKIALTHNWNELFNDRSQGRYHSLFRKGYPLQTLLRLPLKNGSIELPRGLIKGHKIAMLLDRLTLPYHNVSDFTKFPIPFACVATDLSTGMAVHLDHGFLSQAMRASSALPSILEPITIDSITYVDGGISRNIPASDARALGADVVITSDVGTPIQPADSLKSLVDVIKQTTKFNRENSTKKQYNKSDIVIRPDIENYSSSDFGKAARLIKIGERAARKMLPQLKTLADSVNQSARTIPSITDNSSTYLIKRIGITGGNASLRKWFKKKLHIHTPARLKVNEIERIIDRIYNSNLFSDLSYRLPELDNSSGYVLNINIAANNEQQVGLGVRYDSEYRASLLLTSSVKQLFSPGDALSAHLRLGKQLQLQGNYFLPFSLYPQAELTVQGGATRSPVNSYDKNQYIATTDIEQLTLTQQVGKAILPDFFLGAGLHGEFYNLDEATGDVFLLNNASGLLLATLQLYSETLNQSNFASSGHELLLKSSFSNTTWGSQRTFSQHLFNGRFRLPVTASISLLSRLTLARTFSGNKTIPLHYHYYAGGALPVSIFPEHQFPLIGYDVQQLQANNLRLLKLGGQFRLPHRIYLQLIWNSASLTDSWRWKVNRSDFKSGFGLRIGKNTILGPAEVTLMTQNFAGPYSLRINVGYPF